MNNLEFAIDMELDGEKYYLEQANKNRGNSLAQLFLMLAKDESHHAKVLRDRLSEQAYVLEDEDILVKSRNVFEGIKDFKHELKEVPNQLDVYRAALKMEQRSIDLYEELLRAVTDDTAKRLFEYLAKQEQDHFTVLEELVIHVGRPEEWVESAEFGRRKEY